MSTATVLTDPREFSALVSDAFAQSDVRGVKDAPFKVRFQPSALSRLALARVTSSPHLIEHHETQSIDDPARMIKVIFQLSGTGILQQDGVECLAGPGTMMAYDTAKPYRLVFREPNDTIVLGIPYIGWLARTSIISRRTGSAVASATGTGGILSALLGEMLERDDSRDTSSAAHLADALVALTTSAFADMDPSSAENDILDRALTYAQANLSDPSLSVESLARRHNVSVRYLQKRATERGITISTWIRSERLGRIRADLTDPLMAGIANSQIATRWGILDAAHLSRLLRNEFGTTVAELRAQAGPPRS